MSQELVSILRELEYQLLKTITFTPTDEQLVEFAQGLLNAAIDAGDTIIDINMPTTLLGCALDWSAGSANDATVAITKGGYSVTQDMEVDNIGLSVAGYQEVGLSGKTVSGETGLSGGNTYYFKTNIDSGGLFEYNIAPVDNGNMTWTLRTSTFTTSMVRGVKYDGSTNWVIVGEEGKLATATDPTVTWTSRTSSFGGSDRIIAVEYEDSTWVAVGDEGANNPGKLATAADPTGTWTQNSSAATVFSGGGIRDVAYDGSTNWVIVGEGPVLATATDPTGTWTRNTSPDSIFGTDNIRGIGYGNGLWVAVGQNGKMATATDPTGTWTARTSNAGGSLLNVIYGNGTWVTVGDANSIAYSTDGLTWTAVVLGHGDLFNVDYSSDKGLWVAVGDSTIATSLDGEIWTDRTAVPPFVNGNWLRDVSYGADLWVIVGEDGELATAPAISSGTNFTGAIALMDAEISGASWSITGGDLRLTSDTFGVNSKIILGVGTTGTDLFGALTDYTSFDSAVDGS